MISEAEARSRPIYTVGHSTRTIQEFVDLLRVGNLQHVVDVRTIPRSRTNPQYNLDTLPDTLAGWQIGYTVIPELGGRRNKQKTVDPEVNAFWNNQSFHNYADYAMSDEFRAGLNQLLTLGAKSPCVIMCSEAVWWRCHRRIITDYLLMRGRSVFHLMGTDRIEPAKATPAAMAVRDWLSYPKLGD